MPLTLVAELAPLRIDDDGVVRVGGTRVTLDTVVARYLEGDSADAIAENLSSLNVADVYATIGYYLRHRAEVDAYLMENAREAAGIRRESESHQNPAGIRARLEARRRARE